jgi:hypothetical protein
MSSTLTRRSFVSAAAAVAIAAPARAENSRSAVVAYQSFQKQQLQLRPYVGRNVALLLDPAREPAQLVIGRILAAIDRAWDWYADMFGRTPTPSRQHSGKATIAEVSGSCGAGCGLVGFTGIEVAPRYVGLILDQAARDLHFQLVFYELGRNFFFYREPVGQLDALITGFAHVNRFYCMDAIGVMGGPWGDGLDWEVSRHDVLVDLLDRYIADPKLTWRNTIAEYKAPENPRKWDGAAFAASLYYKIRRDHGSAGYRRFWKLMAGAPKADTPQESVERFVQIARAATGEDYRPLFRDSSLALTVKTTRMTDSTLKGVTYRGHMGQTAVKGQVTRTAGNEWIETNDYQNGSRFTFRSISEIPSEIVLYDESRDIYLSLDLAARKTWWRRAPQPEWNVQFDIVSVQK